MRGQARAGHRPGNRPGLLRCLPGGRVQAGWPCRLSQRAWRMRLMVIIIATARTWCAEPSSAVPAEPAAFLCAWRYRGDACGRVSASSMPSSSSRSRTVLAPQAAVRVNGCDPDEQTCLLDEREGGLPRGDVVTVGAADRQRGDGGVELIVETTADRVGCAAGGVGWHTVTRVVDQHGRPPMHPLRDRAGGSARRHAARASSTRSS